MAHNDNELFSSTLSNCCCLCFAADRYFWAWIFPYTSSTLYRKCRNDGTSVKHCSSDGLSKKVLNCVAYVLFNCMLKRNLVVL